MLRKVGTDQFKVIVPTAAPFTMMLPIAVSNGSITDNSQMVTISAGTMESAPLTVMRTSGTIGAVTVDISTLPSLPTGHTGYTLAKSNQTPLEIFSEINVAPEFDEDTTTSRDVAENTESGENIGSAVSATDRNNDTLTYSLGGTNAAAFDIDETNGQLKTKAPLDFEFKSTYAVTITVSDSVLTDTIIVTINVTDIDETSGNVASIDPKDNGQPNNDPMFTDGDSTDRSIAENTGSGVDIGSPIDADDDDVDDTLRYSLGGTDAGSFSIDSTDGQLRTSAALDYEQKQSYTVVVSVDDGEGGSDSITVTINIIDVDESPANRDPNFEEGDSTDRSVLENTGSGVDIGSPVDADDDDVDDTLRYSLGGTDAGSFSIDSTDGQLRTSAALDYEQKQSYTVVVSVDDGEGGSDSITVTINVIDVDESPANRDPTFEEGDSTDRNVLENTGSGVDIGDPVAADDDDEDDTLRYSLGGTDAGSFSIDSTDGQLRTSAALDYENTQSYNVVVSVSDGEGGSDSITVTINVIDVDETPVNNAPTFDDSDPTTRSVDENTSSGVDIGSAVSATDHDGDTLFYTLGGTDAASFAIESGTGQLRTSAALDHESRSSYEVTVNVSDNNGGTDSISVTIEVSDVNEAPFFASSSTSRTIAENVGPGINIGSAVNATDPEEDDLTYTLGGTDADDFNIESDTGQLQTKVALDYEEKSSYAVVVTVTDGSLEDTISVTITIRDLAEVRSNVAPEFTDDDPATRSVPENTAAGENIGDAISAEDDDSTTLFYLLSGTDASSFSIDEDTGQLKTNAPLNFEGKKSYQVTVTVSDGSLTDEITVTINVTNVNEAPAFDSETARREVDENTEAGQNIGQPFSAEDPDEDDDTLTYSLEGTDAAAFDIGSATGQLQTKAALDFESKTTYSVTVKASDSEGLNDTIAVTINVQDVDENRAPTFTDGADTERSVDENTGSGVNFGTPVAARDDDPDDTLQYSMGGEDAASFDINSTSGQLRTKAALDFEVKHTYSVIVSVTDNKGGNDSINVTIRVNDVQENRAPSFSDGTATERSVDENTGAGVDIGTPVAAEDDDPDDTLQYSLGGTDAASFDINSTSGQLRTKAALDYEDKHTYSVIVSVTDNNGGNDSINVTIRVNDINEAPEFANASATFSVDENTASGENIGAAITATDPDDGDTRNYILEGTDASAFDIVSTTGQVLTKDPLNHELEDTYSVIVKATDIGGLTDTIDVTININDVAEAPKFLSNTITLSVDENTATGNNIGSPIPAATDEDGDNITYSLGGPDASHFTFDTGTRQLKANTVFDYDTDARTSYTVTITATDDSTDTLSSFVTVTVTVNNVEYPPIFEDDSKTFMIAENTVSGTDFGSPITADDDDQDTLSYTLEGTDAAAFNINSETGQLKTESALDSEEKDTYFLIVRATDDSAATLSDTIDVTINVTDINEVPMFTEGSTTTRSVNENAIVGAPIGDPVSAKDGDGDTLMYTLGGTDAAKFTLDSATGQLRVKDLLDQDADDSHEVTITATDPDGSNTNIAVTIEVKPPQITTPLADRSPRARATILAAVRALDSVDDNIQLNEITLEHLQSLTSLLLDNTETEVALKRGDFDDLTGLTFLDVHFRDLSKDNIPIDIFRGLISLIELDLYANKFTTLPTGLFDGLTVLEKLHLQRNDIHTLNSGVFRGLTSLKYINLSNNPIGGTISSDVFDDLTALEYLEIRNSRIAGIASGTFDKLTALEELYLNENRISSLPGGVFDKLTALERLDLPMNRISSLPSDIFDKLTALERLELNQNSLTTLPSGIFDKLTALKSLDISKNKFTTIPSMIFDDLEVLVTLDLSMNSFTSFAAADFNGLDALQSINLSKNKDVTSLPEDLFTNTTALTEIGLSYLGISTLPSDIFDGLASLTFINLSHSEGRSLTTLPADIFQDLPALKRVNLWRNAISTLPDGIFAGIPQLSTLDFSAQSGGFFLMNIWLVTGDETGEFKASYPVGAVSNTNVKVIVNNGTIDGETANSDGTYTITIAQGSVESDTYTVSRTSGTTGAVSVYINALTAPNQPSGHKGYKLMNQTPSNRAFVIYAAGAGAPTAVINNKSVTPVITTLLPNYPNPFNPETWIPYQLSKSSDVTITIYNMRGVAVRILALGHQKAGYYTTRKRAAYWDGRNIIGEKVAAGVYFTTFKAGDFSATRKMLIRK